MSHKNQKLNLSVDRLNTFFAKTNKYPIRNELDLSNSEKFVPKYLKLFLLWIFNNHSFLKSSTTFCSDTLRKWVLSSSENIIYCARRGKSQVIPSLHLDLGLWLEHEFGSRTLVEMLNGCGFCLSYDELRIFLTSAVLHEQNGIAQGLVPSGIFKRTENGLIIHEGNDNIDINIETIDEKNTYHSMARVLIQDQHISTYSINNISRIKRVNQRSLNGIDGYQSYTSSVSYTKPRCRPEPSRYEMALNQIIQSIASADLDLTWVLLRGVARNSLGKYPNETVTVSQIIPMWTGFNTSMTKPTNFKTIVSYLPSINEKPSDLKTVYTVLKQGSEIAQYFGQSSNIHTFDQQLYAVAQDVVLNCKDEFPNTVIRLGGFYSLCTFIACIGKLWGDGGLIEMLVDSGLYALGSAQHMMEGKQFHRSVRALTIAYEALMQLLIRNFFLQLENTNEPVFLDLIFKIKSFNVHYTHQNFRQDEYEDLLKEISKTFVPAFQKFRENGRLLSPTFCYWDDCLNAIQIMLNFIRAEREGNWEQHLAALAAMLPYFFFCNRNNYARYLKRYKVA